MNKTKRPNAGAGLVMCSALATMLTGCTTYVERPHHTVHVPPPPPPAVVVIHTDSDFYEPLSPHGEWVVVASYGRCWRPTRVEAGWRPYCNGYWRRTDAGWYWASDEPWGWATYHYGRWDFSVRFGWVWIPHTQWAPAWVSWRHGAGYVGWAPLPPSARVGRRGIVEVRHRDFAPNAFVFVKEPQLLEPVRPTTVIVNNTTVINQTVNVTQVKVVNQTVINDGPRPEVIERKIGRRIEAIPVRELRHKEETEVVARRPDAPSASRNRVEAPARTEAPPRTIPPRDARPTEKSAEAAKQPPAVRDEVRRPAAPETKPAPAAPGAERRGVEGRPQENRSQKSTPAQAPVSATPAGKPATIPGRPVPLRETRPVQKPAEAAKQPQTPANRSEVRGTAGPKPVATPARPGTGRPAVGERPGETNRTNVKPRPQQPGSIRKHPQPPARKVEKPRPESKTKPAPARQGGKDQKKPAEDEGSRQPKSPQ